MKKAISLLFVFIILLNAFAFSEDMASGRYMAVSLYYPSAGGTGLVSINVDITIDSNMTVAQTVLRELFSGRSVSLESASRISVESFHCEYSHEIITVSLSSDCLYNKTDKEVYLMFAAIANTLLGIDDISAVNLLVDDTTVTLCGNPVGVFTAPVQNVELAFLQIQAEQPSSDHEIISRNTVLYYPSAFCAYLIPEVHEIHFSPDSLVAALLEEMTTGPDSLESCSPCIPQFSNDLTIESVYSVDEYGRRYLELTLSPAFENYIIFSGVEYWKVYGCLVLSCTSLIPDIDGVVIRLGEQTIKELSIDGETRSIENVLLKRNDFLRYIGCTAEFSFADSQNKLVSVQYPVSGSAFFSAMNLLNAFVAANPAVYGLESAFPIGMEPEDILSVHVTNGLAAVDISDDLYCLCQSMTDAQESLFVYSIVNTLCTLNDVRSVCFTVEGHQMDVLSDTIHAGLPLMPKY